MSNIKNSGFEWLGKVPEKWNVERLQWHIKEINIKNNPIRTKDILSLTNKLGVVPYEEKGNQGNKAKENYSDYKIAFKDTIVANSMNILIGSVGYCNYFGCVSPVYYVFKELEGNNLKFINYIMQTNEFQKELRKYANGILEIRLRVSADDILKRFVAVPSLDIQNKIVKFLDEKCNEIYDTSNKIQKQIDTLQEYKKSLIKELFDLYLNKYAHIYTKLWHLATLVTKQTGFDYATIIKPSLVGDLNENTIPFLQTRNFKDNLFDFETEYYIPKKIANLFPQITLNKKCLLFSIVGASIGNVAVFPATQQAFLGGAICKVDLKDETLYEYVKHYMMSLYGQNQILTKINVNAQGTITVQNVRDFKIPIFNNSYIHSEIIAKADKISNNIYSIIKDKQQQIEMLEEYKKSLIYEYVTGKKEVI